MSALSINPPYPIFAEADGQPLEDGYIWIGTVNLDPQTNPIAVYWDAALTLAAAQPIRTNGGYPVNSGTPATLYANSDYSIRVQNKNGSTVYSAAAATERYSDAVVTGISAAEVTFTPAGTGAVATSVQTKLRETVSVKDFGAVGDGVTDDTAAIQAAVTYCVAYNKDLIVDGQCLLTASVNIDRLVDTAIYSAYFTILTNSGGGFLINSAIPMFSTTIPFTTAPVTQLVRFQNLIFKNTHAGSGHYVLDDAKFLRTSFIGCTFWAIQCLYAPTVYTQSIYFDNCNMRYGSNQFFTSSAVSYDIKVHNCLCEAGGEWFHLVGAVGCSFVQNTMEGSTTAAAIVINGGNGLEVSGNYFEANAIDLDFSLGDHLGHSITGNYFGPTASAWQVYWGVNISCVSKGNYCTGNLHNLASVTNIDINDYALGTIASKAYNTPIFGELVAPKTSGEVYSLGGAEVLAIDSRSILVGTDFANINLGTTGGTAIITIACTGIQPGVNYCSQIGEWFVTRGGTGGVTLTSKQSQSSGVAPVTAATSGDSIILTYTHAGASACLYKTSIKVAGVTGSGVAGQYPTITIL